LGLHLENSIANFKRLNLVFIVVSLVEQEQSLLGIIIDWEKLRRALFFLYSAEFSV